MTENGGNIIPFRRPTRPTSVPNAKTQLPENGASAKPHDQTSFQQGPRPISEPRIIRKPPPPKFDIELNSRLSALSFLPPHEFLKSIESLSAASRKAALVREADLLATKMANDHRVFVLAGDPFRDVELFYRECYRLKATLDRLTADFGRATIFNQGAFAVVFGRGGKSAWCRKPHEADELHLSDGFREDDVIELLRPRLKPANAYEHELFDVSHRNN